MGRLKLKVTLHFNVLVFKLENNYLCKKYLKLIQSK